MFVKVGNVELVKVTNRAGFPLVTWQSIMTSWSVGWWAQRVKSYIRKVGIT